MTQEMWVINYSLVEIATGALLDRAGNLYGVFREAGEPDADYRERILKELKHIKDTSV